MLNESEREYGQNYWIVYDCKITAYFLFNATTLFAIFNTILLFFRLQNIK